MFAILDQVTLVHASSVCSFGFGVILSVGPRTAKVYWFKNKKETCVPFTLLERSE